ncbi:MAG: T9SS type A sorting domain-containing protein [Bacteroidetes bacterium]|nr:T9SS type A sorting domain-containing protein [Bacteroidota bacterium]
MMKSLSAKLIKTVAIAAAVFTSEFVFSQTISSYSWTQSGPVYSTGRFRNTIIDASDPTGQTLYSGSATSGLFVSTNGGVLWSSVSFTPSNISYIAQDANKNILVATGEGFLRPGPKASALRGTGLYKYSAGTFTKIIDSSLVGAVINRIACHPSNAQIIAMATNLGVLVSTNGGASFTQMNTMSSSVNTTTTNVCYGIDVKFDNAGYLYCSVGNENGYPISPINYNQVSSKVFKSCDNSTYASANDITPTTLSIPFSNYGRIELAISPSNNDVIYASCSKKFAGNSLPNSSTLMGLFVCYNATSINCSSSSANWQFIAAGSSQVDPLSNGGTVASGDYAHSIIVDPFNSDKIYIGSYQFYTWVKTGSSSQGPVGTWTKLGYNYYYNTPYYLKENVHNIAFQTSGGSIAAYYFSTDAGIYKSSDNLASFQPFYKGMVTGQFNSVAPQAKPNFTLSSNSIIPNMGFVGGTTGNGLTYYTGQYPLVLKENNFLGGNVYACQASKIIPNFAYFSSDAGTIYKISDYSGNQPQQTVLVNYTPPGTNILNANPLNNSGYNVTGSPIKLWENYGQVTASPDSIVFYNDSVQVAFAFHDVPTLTTSTQFNFAVARPQPGAQIDHIAIRTGTGAIATDPSTLNNPSYWGQSGDKTQFYLDVPSTFTMPASGTYTLNTGTMPSLSAPVFTAPTFTVNNSGAACGTSVATNNQIIFNSTSGVDQITVTFTAPPFATKSSTYAGSPQIVDPSPYYRVFCTVFYKYNYGDSIKLKDNTISGSSITYTAALTPTSTPMIGSQISWGNSPTYSSFASGQNRLIKIAKYLSGRLAMAVQSNTVVVPPVYSILVSNAPLNVNNNLSFVKVVDTRTVLTCDNMGNKTSNTLTLNGQRPTVIHWSNNGRELYFGTDQNKLYRVSYIDAILDSSSSNYNGKIHTNCIDVLYAGSPVTYTNIINNRCPYRTTYLGKFPTSISSIATSNSDSFVVVTLLNNGAGNNVYMSNPSGDIRKVDSSNVMFYGMSLPNRKIYCSMIEKSTNTNRILIGTDQGIYGNDNISAATNSSTPFSNANGSTAGSIMPNVQVFDIKQQKLDVGASYNSGMIYAATNGLGVWTNKAFFAQSYVGINEQAIKQNNKDNNLTIFPNPSSSLVNVKFNSSAGENATLSVMDINGRIVLTEKLGKLYEGEVVHTFDASQLTSGVYFVTINSQLEIKRVGKLIITK